MQNMKREVIQHLLNNKVNIQGTLWVDFIEFQAAVEDNNYSHGHYLYTQFMKLTAKPIHYYT